ncbi:YceI family protein [Chitinimonas sp.]|uniref:YceI family protein n=1 Tax=Chitinimonas sp. TaxID=1934313 RepID=UPI0035B3E1E6
MQSKLIVSLLSAALAAAAFAAPEKLVLEPTHTKPTFEVNHLGFSTTRGFFKDTSGTLELDRAAKTGKLEASIKAASIVTGVDKLDDHLKSKDFFNVAEFPAVTVKADKFTFDGDKPTKAEGSLTLLGVTKPVVLNIAFNKCDTRFTDQKFVCGAEVTTTIKRSEWGMKTYVPAVGDDIKIAVQVEAYRP